MELQKQTEHLEFKWKDVTFTVRGRGTAEDKFEIDVLYDVDKAGTVKVPRREIYRTLIARFVTGWHGVTEGGKTVPFSLEALGRLPVAPQEDVILDLGSFIFNHCGLWPKTEETEPKKG